MEKTIGELIDELSITNIKIAFLVAKIESNQHTREDASKVQELNRYRSALKNAINQTLGGRPEVKV